MTRKRKPNKWIKGPLSDWIVPYKYNLWFQFAHALFIVIGLCIVVFLITKNFNALFIAYLTFFSSMTILAVTEFGKGTVQAYRRTRQTIEREGTFGPRLQEKFGQKLYCYRAGSRAAAIEYGLSQKLTPALANKWRPF
jgi:hypothetical protein